MKTHKKVFFIAWTTKRGRGENPLSHRERKENIYVYDFKKLPRTSSTQEKMTKTAEDVEVAVLAAS